MPNETPTPSMIFEDISDNDLESFGEDQLTDSKLNETTSTSSEESHISQSSKYEERYCYNCVDISIQGSSSSTEWVALEPIPIDEVNLNILLEKTSWSDEDLSQIKERLFNLVQCSDNRDRFGEIVQLVLDVIHRVFDQNQMHRASVLDIMQTITKPSSLFEQDNLIKFLQDDAADSVQQQDNVDIFVNICCVLQQVYSAFPVTYAEYVRKLIPSLESKNSRLLKNGIDVPLLVKETIDRFHGLKEEPAGGRFIASGAQTGTAQFREPFYRKKKEQNEVPEGNFRDIAVFPEGVDILVSKSDLFLKPNLIKGSYRNVEHYLDVQFRLMREDLVGSLRDSIKFRMNSSNNSSSEADAIINGGKHSPGSPKKPSDLKLYSKVQVIASELSQHGILHTLQFDVSKLKNKIDWDNSRKLLHGSIVCLSPDKFQTLLFAIVMSSSPTSLKNGRLKVLFDDLNYQIKPIDTSVVYVMIECEAYFEAYRYCLLQLKEMNANNFPFQKYIVTVHNTLGTPVYLKESTTYDLSCLKASQLNGPMNSARYTAVPVLKIDRWPPESDLELDDSQLNAVKSALTQEFSLIQGPPGTGKTYVGLKIVQTLLENYKVWYEPCETPIMVVCYTNHALDQFMEGLLQFTNEIARIGGRCESTLLQPYTVSYLKKARCNSINYADVSNYVSSINRLKERISELQELLSAVRYDFFRVFDLMPYVSRIHTNSFNPDDKMWGIGWDFHSVLEYWLGYKQDEYALEIDAETKETLISVNKLLGSSTKLWKLTENLQMIRINEESEDELHSMPQSEIANGGSINSTTRTEHLSFGNCNIENAMTDIEVAFVENVWNIDLRQRWRLYRWWLNKCLNDKIQNLRNLTNEYNMLVRILQETRTGKMIKAVRGVKVIGMTTTGAAKYAQVVTSLCPKILIVEEAAEVFEAHVVTSLCSSMKHVILLGDHQQLSPNPAVYELARKFNLGVSLFERMIRNNIPFQQLKVQHRMRPAISSLLVPEIYADLRNHQCVLNFDDIRGVVKNLYFFTHHELESGFQNGTSYVNYFEAEFATELCWYLSAQGYGASQITILSFYSAQVNEIKEMVKVIQHVMGEIRVSTVDNFQGEESDIIILSLVRSNQEGNVGFLTDPKRICVALSRARMAFYAIGNFDIMARSNSLWTKIAKKLGKMGSIGSDFQIRCQNHPNRIATVVNGKNFRQQAPLGGCHSSCSFVYLCGHKCLLFCHPNRDKIHEQSCPNMCQIQCPYGHPCLKACHYGSACGPCELSVNKVCSECGKTFNVACWEETLGDCPLHLQFL